MPEPVSNATQEFDRYAKNYDAALAQGISVSGEDKDFFARGRIDWLARCFRELSVKPQRILDFGCGTGSAAPHLNEVLTPNFVTGVDISEQSIAIARQRFGSASVNFEVLQHFRPNESFDLAFCNGVFHHIPPGERTGAVKCVYDAVRPGGYFAFWENNPWNPGTRYVMSRIPFDRDAIMLSAPEARRLLFASGFEILRTDFLFIFPRVLNWFRRFEPAMAGLPFGAQYQVLARKRAHLKKL
jgi:SAM-dependent methyltransferase